MRRLAISPSITRTDSDSLDKYFREVAGERLLTPDEEVDLAHKIRKGDQDSLERLVRANLRFVISIAKQYQNQGLSLSDLICEGNIGLIKAAERYDETRGFKFISFSVWWIRNSIIQAIKENANLIRLPKSRMNLLFKVNRKKAELEQLLGREPNLSELAEAVEMGEVKVKELLALDNKKISLESSSSDDDKIRMIDVLESTSVPPTDDNLISESLHHDVESVLKNLRDREREVITYYFGLNGQQLDIQEISDRMGLTAERVRQIKERALVRLRHNKGRYLLRKYLS